MRRDMSGKVPYVTRVLTRGESSRATSSSLRFVIQIQILPGKKNFFLQEEKLARKIFFEKFFYTGKLNPETGIHFLSENLLLI